LACKQRRERLGDLTSIRLENDLISVAVIPELGGKIHSILDRRTDTEFVWKNPHLAYRKPSYGAAYHEFDSSGIDECVPTVAPCGYPNGPWKGIQIPDHGEVWSIPWKCRQLEKTRKRTAIALEVHGVRFPYHIAKNISLADGRSGVAFRYELTNHSHEPFLFVWALHALLNVDERSRIFLPHDTRAVVTWSRNHRLVQDQEFLWPLARDNNGNDVDLTYIGPVNIGFADKIVTTSIPDGWCALWNEGSKIAVVLRFPRRTVTNIGVWLNMGGWGNPGHPEHNNIALEPQIGWDQLDIGCSKYHQYGVLRPGASQRWKVDVGLLKNVDASAFEGE